jgi:hypothetical protein
MASKKEDNIGGLKVEVKSGEFNIGVYKEITGKVIFRESKSKIKKKGVSVFIRNTYYGQLPPPDPSSIQPLVIKVTEKATQNEKRTVLREFAVGVGIQIAGQVLPITGVRTEARIRVGSETRDLETILGTVPK